MVPLPAKVLHRRGDNSGRTFSIIFAIIALLVVLGCLIWGIILPRYRKTNLGRPRGRLAANRTGTSNAQFPSHPALLRGFRQKSSIALRQYNPRIESPFPSNPAQSTVDHSLPPSCPPPARLLGAPTHSDGLFTPAKDRLSSRRGRYTRYSRLFQPKALVGHESQSIMTKVNAVEDYVLPIPEALVLKPRPAGRPPPLTKQLGMFPVPQGHVKRKGGLVHPVKLFQDLDQRDSKSTADTFGTPCPAPCHASCSNAERSSVLQVAIRIESPSVDASTHAHPEPVEQSSSSCAKPPSFRHDTSARSVRGGITAVPATNRPGKRLPLGKTGALTRPTTPTPEICELRDRTTADEKTESASFKRGYTPSTNPFTTPEFSSTPPTSSIISTNTVPALSTPLRLPGAESDSCVTTSGVHHHQRTPSSMALPPPVKLTTTYYDLPDKTILHTRQNVYPTHALTIRPRTARFKLPTSCDLQTHPVFMQRHSISSLSTIIKPIMATARGKVGPRASSIYSRDTKGMSFGGNSTHAQIAPNTAEVVTRPWLSIGEHLDSFQQEDNITDVLKSKIDEWDLHTAHLDASLLHSSALKRSISDSGPRGARLRSYPIIGNRNDSWKRDSGGRGRSVPTIRIGPSSDDVFGNDVRNIHWARAVQTAEAVQRYRPEPTLLGALERGTAPGGGQWI
ncbi:hypothetical protein A1O3_00999 [Capronia epimyces CBS 606.96]|uniref:Uncharacterized protein n=1 Tax=Capronia epimyces CBS 606.96 TaxID=1182542 RepID=W9YIV4_9EURO|nr:uncharacterized protein A1O3_00999 [Capronia epimyces CBS 606.96]EXJ92448.1 hypothetical protein A1O3_00999 [Capronia epimyces CBS 606.96]